MEDIHEEIQKLIVKKKTPSEMVASLANLDEEVNDLVVEIGDTIEMEICKALASVYNAYYDELSTNGYDNLDDDAFYGRMTTIVDEMSIILVEYWQ
jgi:hypothetical protein